MLTNNVEKFIFIGHTTLEIKGDKTLYDFRQNIDVAIEAKERDRVKKNLYRNSKAEPSDMSVCVSVIPVCATNQELTFSQFVSSLSVYANY